MSNVSEADVLLHGIRDPRLAVHATSVLPAWLWSLDGARVLWTNAAGARVFGARNAAILAERTMVPRTRIAARPLNLQQGCRRPAPRALNGCAVSARRSAAC